VRDALVVLSGALLAALLLPILALVVAGPDTALERFGLPLGLGPPRTVLAEVHAEEGEGFEHRDLDELLRATVDDEGWVDYGAVEARSGELDAYLARLAAVDLDALRRDALLALYINAYNAFTLRLILDHRPLGSIQDIPEAERWAAERWALGGETVSLDQIEHERLRGEFADPRIHFAIVCASVGCPPLWNRAYEAATIDRDLALATARVHRPGSRWLEVERSDAGARLRVTRLYLWYAGDFAQAAGSPLGFLRRHVEGLEEGAVQIGYLPYDWTLNGPR
jgi:hypothetical protein